MAGGDPLTYTVLSEHSLKLEDENTLDTQGTLEVVSGENDDDDDDQNPPKPAGRARMSYLGSQGVSPEDASACLGMSKAIDILETIEINGCCAVEKTSVYGAAIAIPQIARSSYWPKTMSILTLRSFMFLGINYLVQTAFVYYILDSQTNMNPFGGQMHLCDFASHISHCPDRSNCHGPGGKEIADPGSLYPYDVWNTRRFVRDSLKILFPDRVGDIDDNVDPGEYGVESFYCRLLCIFVFMVSIGDEFQNILDFFRLLWYLPTAAQPWVQYEIPSWASKQHVKDVHGMSELDFVQFTVAGMPLQWKIFNFVFLLLPKIFIWRMLSMAGVHFLMETAGMVDQIVNTTALSFVFTIDELLLDRLTTKATRHIMSSIQEYSLYDSSHYETETDQDALDRYYKKEMQWTFRRESYWLLPRRLFWSLALMTIFIAEYYFHSCDRLEDGSFVSKSMALPAHPHLNFGCFVSKFVSSQFFAQCVDGGSEPFWTMPS
eukprot:TRINITY_DN22974_c0_g4_i2.p1 TRINITY_DN22974_c0_g4~~TRINITY_DN22974_c0_g4_i2.p1  ORF type:complete len:490 (+),score=59.75 TRINITY_DN22974_c0_g4_i2:54-1523(+)